jgi:hypothetical protein
MQLHTKLLGGNQYNRDPCQGLSKTATGQEQDFTTLLYSMETDSNFNRLKY